MVVNVFYVSVNKILKFYDTPQSTLDTRGGRRIHSPA